MQRKILLKPFFFPQNNASCCFTTFGLILFECMIFEFAFMRFHNFYFTSFMRSRVHLKMSNMLFSFFEWDNSNGSTEKPKTTLNSHAVKSFRFLFTFSSHKCIKSPHCKYFYRKTSINFVHSDIILFAQIIRTETVFFIFLLTQELAFAKRCWNFYWRALCWFFGRLFFGI